MAVYQHQYHHYQVQDEIRAMIANSSYLLGDDPHWGKRYYYTFYSEFGSRDGMAAMEVVMLSVTLVMSILLNGTIACAVLRYREMRTVINCFLLNLAAADLLFALGIPAVAFTRISQDWKLSNVFCKILPYTQFVCGFVLLWTLTLISMDRYRCIVVPPYRSQLTPRLAALLTLLTWLLAAILFLPVVFWFRQQTAEGHTFCTIVFPISNIVNWSICFTVPVLIFACILPMGLLVFHYHRIFLKLLKTRNRWSANSQAAAPVSCVSPRRESGLSVINAWTRKVSTASQTSMGNHTKRPPGNEEARLARHMRVIRIVLLNVVAVVLMWLPITVIMFLIYVDGSRPTEDTRFFLRSHHFIWALLIALLNTVVNPLLYGVLSENFRSCFAKLWLGSYRRRRKALQPDQRSAPESSPCGSSGRWNEGYSPSPPRPSPDLSQQRCGV